MVGALVLPFMRSGGDEVILNCTHARVAFLFRGEHLRIVPCYYITFRWVFLCIYMQVF